MGKYDREYIIELWPVWIFMAIQFTGIVIGIIHLINLIWHRH